MESNIIKEEFKKDTDIIVAQTKGLLETLYPSYLIDDSKLSDLIEKSSPEILDSFVFFRIKSCSIDDKGDAFKYLNQKMQKLFSAIHSLGMTIAYGVISYENRSNLVIGIRNVKNVEAMSHILQGLLSGVELEKVNFNFMNKEHKPKYHGIFPAIPSCKIDEEEQTFDISPLMRSLNGQDYTMLVIARPMLTDEVSNKIRELLTVRDACFAVSKRNISRQKEESIGKTHSDGGNESRANSISNTTTSSTNKGIGFILNYGKSSSESKTDSSTVTKGTSWEDSISNTISTGETISADIQNGFAIELINYAESGIERFKLGQSCGMWQTSIAYSSSSKLARDIIQASLNAEIAKPNAKLLPAKLFSQDNFDAELMIPKQILGEKREDNQLCTCLTSTEIGLLCTFPTDGTPDFELKEYKQYPLVSVGNNSEIEIGKLSDSGRVIQNMSFFLSEEDLNKHSFICGITGSGKTTTVKGILANCNKPYMVIEAAKKEYRHIQRKKDKDTVVYTLGKPEINCLQMNPFYIMPGVSPQTHIDLLKDLFNASFSFYGPMPYILEKCLQNIYIKKGWNLVLGYNPYLVNKDNPLDFFDLNYMQNKYAIDSHKYLFPTMYDLKCEVERYIEKEMQYEGEVAGNIKTAIKVRLDSLCNGSKGFMFNTNNYADMEKLLNSDVIIELEGLADDSDKAFCVGLLIIFINEHRQVQKEMQGNKKCGLQHLLVIEEAHRLLKNIDTERASENLGNPKGKAVEHFVNLIAEMRSYGQGVIIAEQIPTKLAPDVIKNSSNKIIHRLVSSDDQEIIANTIGIPKEDAIFLGTLRTGFALCHKEGMNKPVNVNVNPVNDIYVNDANLYNQKIQERIFNINSSIVDDAISSHIESIAFKLLNSLLICEPGCCVKAITKAQEMLENKLRENNLKLVLSKDLDKIIANKLASTIMKYLLAGVFSINKLIPDDVLTELTTMLRTPETESIRVFKKTMNNFYSRNPRRVGLLIVSEMLKNQYSSGMDLRKSAENFLLEYETNDINEIIFKIKGGENSDS